MPRLTPAETRTQIVDIIGESVLQALGLKESLEEERIALEDQDIDALNAVLSKKSTCAEQLQALDQQRGAICKHLGFQDGPDQMQQLIDWCDEDRLVSSRWAELVDIAAQGSALNLTNGAIIRVRQQHFESSLSVLRGVAPGSDTYGRNGEDSGDFSRRSLAEA
jgi:flagellar biosynthesis/type III secretory pathway chaperone